MRIAHFLCIAALLLSSAARAAPPKNLIIEADIWCPVNCSANDGNPGIGVELAKRIFEPRGYTVVYNIVPWARTLEDVRAGRAHIAIGAGVWDDKTLLFPNHPLLIIADDFYVTANNPWTFSGIDSLKKRRVGIIKDYGYSEPVQKLLRRRHFDPDAVQEASGDDAVRENINKLLWGDIDVMIDAEPIVEYTLQQMGLKGKLRHAGGVRQGPVYLAFSPRSPKSQELKRLYDEGIANLKATGELEKIYARYGLTLQKKD